MVIVIVYFLRSEEVARRLQGAPDGTFLVHDSTHTGEYTLTIRKGGINRLIRIINKNGKFGFTEPTTFSSVQELIEFYAITPHTLAFQMLHELNGSMESPLTQTQLVINRGEQLAKDKEVTFEVKVETSLGGRGCGVVYRRRRFLSAPRN
jgi:phosphoinositide-3-kinase regulatory subunit